jgi:hypothetical protein
MTDGLGEGEDWETLLDSGKLDESLSKLKVVEKKKKKMDSPRIPPPHPATPASSSLTDPAFSGPVRILTNGCRTEFRGSEPKLKILKRPDPESNKPTEPPIVKIVQKSLEQREAEYAEARLRILGNPPPPPQPTNNNKPKQNNKKAGDGKKTANAAVPKGPDGTKGFQNRR